MVFSAFYWLLGIIPPSFLEAINDGVVNNVRLIPLYVFIAVLTQETARFLFIKSFVFAEKKMMLRARLKKSLFSDFMSAVSSGCGFGVIYALVMHGGVLSAAFTERDTGDYYDVKLCSEMSLYLVSAITALSFQPFHIALSVLMFNAFRQRDLREAAGVSNQKDFYVSLGVPVVMHIAGSLASALNIIDGGCVAGIPIMVVIVLITCVYAAVTVRRSGYVAVVERK